MTKKTVYVLGNPINQSDNSAVNLIPRLKKKYPQIEFVHYDPTEETVLDRNVLSIFIDVVEGIKRVTVFDDLDNFSPPPIVTLHDYDLFIHLKLVQKLKKIGKFMIVGIPPKIKRKDVLEEMDKIFNASGI